MKDYFKEWPKLKVSDDILQDAGNIVCGAYAPLKGFLREKDFKSVLRDMRLEDGKVWSIPVVLDINKEDYENLKRESVVALTDDNGAPRFILDNIEIYPYNKKEFALRVFGTENLSHPGVREVMEMGEYLVGGDIVKIQNVKIKNQNDNEKRKNDSSNQNNFYDYFYTPEQTKEIFKNNGWRTVVAFQTRNVPHRSHEFLQMKALERVDGLFVHPVIGKKKAGDFRDEVILEAYKILMDKYYPAGKSFLGILPLKMRYAGPREAVMHALIRRNYGCTHMIIGRDHAGVGDFYDSYAAHNIFDEFSKDELGIEILKFENVSYCRSCDELRMEKTCPHKPGHKFHLSGTKIRDMIINKEKLPEEFIRKEISEYLINHPNPFV
jgi:sulfate adenylyltransferase